MIKFSFNSVKFNNKSCVKLLFPAYYKNITLLIRKYTKRYSSRSNYPRYLSNISVVTYVKLICLNLIACAASAFEHTLIENLVSVEDQLTR